MSTIRVELQYRYGNWRVGTVVDLPHHVANALCDSPSPIGKPFARRVDEAAQVEELEELTNAELRARLASMSLPTRGTKAELIARLRGAE